MSKGTLGGRPRRPPPRRPRLWKQLLIAATLALIGALIARAVGVIPDPFPGPHHGPNGKIVIGTVLRNQTLADYSAHEARAVPSGADPLRPAHVDAHAGSRLSDEVVVPRRQRP